MHGLRIRNQMLLERFALMSIVVLVDSVLAQNDVRLPPIITAEGPKYEIIFRDEGIVELPCQSYGVPKPTYYWTINGFRLNVNQENVRLTHEGNLQIREASKSVEGYYQCVAENMHGKALTKKYSLRRAFITTLSGSADSQSVQDINVLEGTAMKITPQSVLSHPAPKFEWELASSPTDSSSRSLVLNERIQIDEQGNLCFANVKKEDGHDGKFIYKSQVTNTHLDIKMGGSYRKLIVQSASGNVESPPVPFVFPGTIVAVVGRTLTLECFFAANPSATVDWKKLGTENIAYDRVLFVQQQTKMLVRDVQASDAGAYMCLGVNRLGNNNKTMYIDVQASPTFIKSNQLIRNMNVTEGDDVILRCETNAKPSASVKWYLNGDPIKIEEPPSRFSFDANALELKIRDVCRDCKGDRVTDLMVIQCNSSNIHGYVYASAYINVLRKTTVDLEDSNSLKESVKTLSIRNLTYRCVGKSDASTLLKYFWYNVTDPSRVELLSTDNQGLTVDNGLLHISVSNDFEKRNWLHYGGYFRCVVTNGYSSADLTVQIYVEDAPRSLSALILEMWWLFLVAVLLLILVLMCLMCCVFYLRANKGDKYDVDEKERLNGNDPKKEIMEGDFQDYKRPEGLGVVPMGSQASLAGSSVNFGSLTEDTTDPLKFGTLNSSYGSNLNL